ncbi:octaprenyl diphosphate synthase [Actinobacillus equuli subsp. equuli]|uniref:Octaprenyl diphosphate synthase n=1 Tax=Actinobacillus equuli TaxID=718 RepID=A0AAX3FHT5_ACTEU|nr:octaprenyl diphosphate synthase [Actinobacillus equuli]AIZ79636.1 octaprenyl diphosphate synthase [Actinobacillus equuli subsp. equuli]MDG4952870.1 octaprenyl diphosphate synthase [Actinobacillus equuli subsp. equuli]WGE43749.1 octaprenyl diphosphate synthase [Actinobacillus equuli subsp. equuli]WGE54386.1 octaprenyl diphosphate synthase [Actinobacillus equuli subsp. equuli]WGE72041.1 octaprenyl diphosphate synthase [Actinobacillus equuli subsp. haemolyticus]
MTTLLTLEQIQALAKQDMQAVDAEILAQLNSEVVLINQLGHYIIAGGGKRIRPLIAVLAANALGYTGNKHVTCAAFIEFVHTATLLHDDVVDESDMRRGRATANATFGNAASVLVGDFIYTRSFQMMTSVDSLEVLKVMSAATNALAEGEVQQLMNVNDPNTTEANYMRVIYNKTARLFEAATQCVAIVAGVEKSVETALKNYGCYLGTAFQLIDDILDYSAKAESFGKNVGDDFVEGKPTLPLLHAMHAAQAKGNQAQMDMIRSAIENGGEREQIPAVLEIMAEHQSLEYAMTRAKQEAQKAVDALTVLPESEYKQALISLAYLSVDRSY